MTEAGLFQVQGSSFKGFSQCTFIALLIETQNAQQTIVDKTTV